MEIISNSYLLLLCGAFSSNRGSDFREVLKEIANAEIPMPENNKWANAGLVECDDCQIAWRVLDSQYWGVPQRRKRIFLVADFGKSRRCAGEILFERKSSDGNSETSGKERKNSTTGVERSSGESSEIVSQGGNESVVNTYPVNLQIATGHNALGEKTGFGIAEKDDPAYTLEANHSHGVAICNKTSKEGLTPWDVQSNRIQPIDGIQPALYGGAGQGTHNGAIFDNRNLTEKSTERKEQFVDIYNGRITGNIAPSLTTASGVSNTSGPKVITEISNKNEKSLKEGIPYNVHQNVRDEITLSEQASALTTAGGKPGQGYPCIFQKSIKKENIPEIPSDLILEDEEKKKPKVVFMSGGFSSQRKHDAYALDSISSNSMKSSNPHSGFHKTDVAKTLDTTNPDPSKNQGGILIQEILPEKEEISMNKEKTTYCLSGNIVGRDPKNGGNHLGIDKDVAFTLNTVDRHVVAVPSETKEISKDKLEKENPIIFEPGIASRDGGHIYKDGKAPTLRAQPGDNHPAVAYCLQGSMIGRSDKNGPAGDGINKDVAFTLNTIDRHAVSCYGLDQQGGKGVAAISKDISPTMMSNSHGTPHAVAVISSEEKSVDNVDKIVDNSLKKEEKKNPIKNGKTVRRLTPMEAERLQGLPDGYTLLENNKLCSDSARYKALGNGMAQPCPNWVLQRIVEVCEIMED